MVKKKKQREIIIGVVLVGLFLIVGITQGLFNLSVGSTPSLCSGQVLSVDPQINIEYSNNLNKEVVVVTYSTLPSAECINIRLSESQIENAVDGLDASGDIKLDIRLTEQTKVFNINQENENFKNFISKNIGNVLTGFCNPSMCASEGVNSAFAALRTSPLFGDCWCFAEDVKGIGGDFLLTEGVEWVTDVKLGNLASARLTNDITSAVLSDVAYMEWAGNLVSNVQFSGLVGQKDSYKPYSDNVWRMIPQGTFGDIDSDYTRFRQDLIQCDSQQVGINPVPCEAQINNANSYRAMFDSVTQDQTFDWSLQEPAVIDGGAQIISNQLIAFLQSPVVYPQFKIEIDAEEVGIFQLVGAKPEVTCPDDFNLVSGETATKSLTVKNPGTDTGSYYYTLECNKGSQFLSPMPPQNIDGSSIKTIQATLGMTVAEGTDTASCTFTAVEQTLQQQGLPSSTSCTFSYDATHQSQCIEGTKSCEIGNTQLWICLADGTYDKVTCQYGCEGFGSTYRCRLQPDEICDNGIDDDGDGFIDFDDPDCQSGNWWDKIKLFFKNLFSGTLSVLMTVKYILVFGLGFITIFMSEDFLKRYKAFKGKDRAMVRWIFSVGLGLGVGYLLWIFIGSTTFWVLSGVVLLYFFFSPKIVPKIRRIRGSR